nr:hypothetical protein [uncultured Desulfobacter sp.]
MKLIRFALIVILVFYNAPGLAGDAVSTLNGKMAFSYGDMDSNRGRSLTGSINIPLAKNLGLQADGLYSHVSKRDFYGTGLQLFWRDSDKGLIGVEVAGVHNSDIDSYIGGMMCEYYLGAFTLGVNAGFARIDYAIGPVPFIETDETDPYVGASIGFYPIDNLLLEASYSYSFDNNLYACKIEYQTPIKGFSVFADLATGDQDYDQSLLGIRYYFGKEKSLIRRHREDDPPNIVTNVINNIGTYGAEYNKEAKAYNKKAKAYNDSLVITAPDFDYIPSPMPVYGAEDWGFIMTDGGSDSFRGGGGVVSPQ